MPSSASSAKTLLGRYAYDVSKPTWRSFVGFSVLKGSWYEMGCQYAQQAADYLACAIPGALAQAIKLRGSLANVLEVLPAYEQLINEYFPGYVSFARGVADEGGYPFEHVFNYLLILCPKDHDGDESASDTALPSAALHHACSSVAAWGEATADGHVLGANNADGAASFHKARMPHIVAYPADGHAFILSGRNCSLNSEGLMCLMSAGQDARPDDWGFGNPMIACIYLAAYYGDAEAARDAYVAHARRCKGENLMVVDASGGAFHLESTASHYVCRKPGDFGERSYLIANNAFLAQDMASSLFTGERAWHDTRYRYDTVEKHLLDAYGSITMDALREAEGDRAYYDKDAGKMVYEWHPQRGEYSPCNHGLVFTTLMRRVVDATTRTMYLCEGTERVQDAFVPFALGTWCKVGLSEGPEDVCAAAEKELMLQIWRARRDIDALDVDGAQFRERFGCVSMALAKLYEAQNALDLACLAKADGDVNAELAYHAEALSALCEGQCHARRAQDDPVSLGV